MRQQINEIKRMQQLAGLPSKVKINEADYYLLIDSPFVEDLYFSMKFELKIFLYETLYNKAKKALLFFNYQYFYYYLLPLYPFLFKKKLFT